MPEDSTRETASLEMRGGNGRGPKLRLLTRKQIDGRTKARKRFDMIASGITQDLGGESELTTMQRLLIEATAGVAVALGDFNARTMLGEKIDLMTYAQTVSVLVRISSRLGIDRVPKDIGPPSVEDYVKQQHEEAS